jgi:hypothetical protein
MLQAPSMFGLFQGYVCSKLCCRASSKKRIDKYNMYMMRYKRASERVERDLDIVKILKKLHSHQTQLQTVLTKSEQKLASKLSRKAIMAQTSSESSDFNDNEADKVDTKVETDGENPKFTYLNEVVGRLDQSINRNLV